MSEQQISKLVGALTEHQRHFGKMPTDDRQWVIQNTEAAIILFADVVKNRGRIEVKKLLERLSVTIALPVVKEFTVKDNFVVNVSNKAMVKISGLGDNLETHFLPR